MDDGEVMTAPRFSDAGARLSGFISDVSPSPQRGALALFGFVAPCAIVLAVAVGDAAERPLVLGLAIALAVLQVAYLRYGSLGPRGWALLAVAVPLTLAVTTLAMRKDGDVLLPLLFTSVCWSALSLRGRYVVANVLATIAASAVAVIARWLGRDAGNAAEGLGLLLVSSAGFALVGAVVYRLASALRIASARAEQARMESERARQVSHQAREAFARSAEVVGEYLYSGERLPDESFVMHARGLGIAALLGAEEETQELVDAYDDFVHPDDRPAFDIAWRYADLIGRDGEIMQQEYRLVGVDGEGRWVRDRAGITVLDGSRVLLTGAVRDISDQRRAEEERAEAVRRLEWLSSVDALTELFNRRHFSEVLRARLAGSAAGAAIALVDVDHFKRINDTYGHLTGDAVLREIAGRLKDATRPCDVTSRWGGEEFCVLLDEIEDEHELRALVERLRAAVSATPIAIDHETSVVVTISIGAVRPSPECHTPEQLVASADAALYAAKRGGRNQARIARGAPALVPVATADGLEGVVQALAAAASARGGVAPLHCAQVAALSTAVAVQLDLPAATVELARLGGWLHDCGKVTVPTDILAHTGPLDEQARARVRHHAIAGEALVSVVPGLGGAAQVVRSHHERFDGGGYPDGLAGDEIPIAARIVAAADAFVAMTESRPYEGPRGHREAVAELQGSAGGQFDPDVIAALVTVLEHERRGDQAQAS